MKIEDVKRIRKILQKLNIEMDKNCLFFPIHEEKKVGIMSAGPTKKDTPGYGIVIINNDVQIAYVNKGFNMFEFDFKNYLDNYTDIIVEETKENVEENLRERISLIEEIKKKNPVTNLPYVDPMNYTGYHTSGFMNFERIPAHITKEEYEELIKLEVFIITTDNIIASFR